MAAPAIGRRRRWAPGPGARLDTSHPLAPAVGWIPSMGLRTIHGDACTVINGGFTLSAERGGRSFRTSGTGAVGFPNRITSTLTQLTMQVWVNAYSVVSDAGVLATRGSGIAMTGISTGAGSSNWTGCWSDESSTWGYTGGPAVGGPQLLTVVYDGANGIRHYVDAALASTNSFTVTPAIDFSFLTGATAWTTYDPFSTSRIADVGCSQYLIWPRALSGVEIAQLRADPFCFMRM